MKYLLVLLTIPFLFGFCDIYSTCQVPSYTQPYQSQQVQPHSYSNNSPFNPYATNPPKIYSEDGKYLGQLSANPYLKDSTSNPYGQFGSPYSSDSINNPYSTLNNVGGY